MAVVVDYRLQTRQKKQTKLSLREARRGGGGGGVCERSEVFGFALASSSLMILSARSPAQTVIVHSMSSPVGGWLGGCEKGLWGVVCTVCLVKYSFASAVKLKYHKITLFHILTKLSIYLIFEVEN